LQPSRTIDTSEFLFSLRGTVAIVASAATATVPVAQTSCPEGIRRSEIIQGRMSIANETEDFSSATSHGGEVYAASPTDGSESQYAAGGMNETESGSTAAVAASDYYSSQQDGDGYTYDAATGAYYQNSGYDQTAWQQQGYDAGTYSDQQAQGYYDADGNWIQTTADAQYSEQPQDQAEQQQHEWHDDNASSGLKDALSSTA
jgi:hypothetical protein